MYIYIYKGILLCLLPCRDNCSISSRMEKQGHLLCFTMLFIYLCILNGRGSLCGYVHVCACLLCIKENMKTFKQHLSLKFYRHLFKLFCITEILLLFYDHKLFLNSSFYSKLYIIL